MAFGVTSAWAQTDSQATYAIQVDETHAAGETVEVEAGGEVVATLTFGFEGGADFKAGKAENKLKDKGFVACTEGNGENGTAESGTTYIINPKYDGNIEVGVVLNADKAFYVMEDDVALAEYDGIKVAEKYYGTYAFDVVGGKEYKVFCKGSKLGFYGFNYTFTVSTEPEVTEPVVELVHTASSYSEGTANVFTSTIDAEYEHVNNSNANGTWAGFAYAEFSVVIPKGETITSAKLAFTGRGESRSTRNCDVMYANEGEKLDYTEEGLASGTAKVDLAATKISSVTFPKGADATTDFNVDVTDALKAIVSADQKYIIFKFTGNPGGGDLLGKGSDKAPQLTIETVSASETTSYTVNFLDVQNNVLKEAVVYTSQVIGTEVTASAEDMADFKNEDASKKYIYESGNETITLVEDATANVINLVFREAEVWNYTVNAVNGEEIIGGIAAGTAFEGDVFTQPIPRLLNVTGTIYTAGIAGNAEASKSITMNADNVVVNVSMTATEITNVIYFAEAEDVLTRAEGGNVPVRCSYKAGGYATEATDIVTLAAGTYKVTTAAYANTSTTFVFKAGETEVLTVTGTGAWTESTSEEFTLTENATLTVQGGSASNALDYIYITMDDTATGINTVNAQIENGAIYNLQGQKVQKAQKGLYIINGKKAVVK